MRLVRHKIEGVEFNRAKWIGSQITPDLVVIHDTASRLEKGNAARFLRDNSAKVSAHLIVERDGSLEQQVPTNRRANHAGRSDYHGRKYCNNFSIGIEIVNVGRMVAVDEHKSRTWFKETFDNADNDIVRVKTPEHGDGMWMDYTSEQIETVTALCEALFDSIPTLKDIQPHWYISPGRKVDSNPLFPLEELRARVLGREEPVDVEVNEQSHSRDPGQLIQIDTRGSGLNMRRWPYTHSRIMTSIPNGTIVPVIRQGRFANLDWSLVQFDNQEGWISDTYTAPAILKNMS